MHRYHSACVSPGALAICDYKICKNFKGVLKERNGNNIVMPLIIYFSISLSLILRATDSHLKLYAVELRCSRTEMQYSMFYCNQSIHGVKRAKWLENTSKETTKVAYIRISTLILCCWINCLRELYVHSGNRIIILLLITCDAVHAWYKGFFHDGTTLEIVLYAKHSLLDTGDSSMMVRFPKLYCKRNTVCVMIQVVVPWWYNFGNCTVSFTQSVLYCSTRERVRGEERESQNSLGPKRCLEKHA